MGLNQSFNKQNFDQRKTDNIETTNQQSDKKYPKIVNIIKEYLQKSNEELTIPDSAQFNKGFWCDKFQKTIIRSEQYAFLKCISIQKDLKSNNTNRQFDPDFGAFKSFSIQKQTKLFDQHIPKNKLKWKSMKKHCDDTKKKFNFQVHDCTFDNAVQGNLGNSWMVTGLCAIEAEQHLFYRFAEDLDFNQEFLNQNEMQAMSVGIAPKIFEPFREFGIFVFKFQVDFDWIQVITDDTLPMNENNELVFGNQQKVNEQYLPLFEKAQAKLFGSYECLENGLIEDFMMDSTGFTPMNVKLQNQEFEFPSRQIYKISQFDKWSEKQKSMDEWFWNFLIENKSKGILCCYCRYPPNSERLSKPIELLVKNFNDTHQVFNQVNWKDSSNSSGIMNMIMYQIVDFFEFQDQTQEYVRILRMRNPWGNVEQTGPWSASSGELKYKGNINKLMKLQMELNEDEKWTQFKDDGTFLMDVRDLYKVFTDVTVNKNLQWEFNQVIFKGTWDLDTPGMPTQGNVHALDNFGSNPQIIINLQTVADLHFTLTQDDGRFHRQQQPQKNQTRSIAVVVMRLWPHESKLAGWRDPMLKSVLRQHRHVNLQARLPVGKYAVVVGQEHKPDQSQDSRDWSLKIDYDCDDKKFQYTMDPRIISQKNNNSQVYQ